MSMTIIIVLFVAVIWIFLVVLLFQRTSKLPEARNDMSCSTSSPSPKFQHDVFISFGDKDTRVSFKDELLQSLQKKGISLAERIEESRCAVVVFSIEYASSRWCLDELMKIIDCSQTVFPVFYKVNPSDLRNQTGPLRKIFAKHEIHFKDEIDRVNNWKIALNKLADISGWDLNRRPEFEVIQEIMKAISMKLKYDFLIPKRKFVGICSRVKKIKSCLNLENNDVRIVGIWGMGGIGKTTLAKHVLKDIYNQFEACSFVPNTKKESGKSKDVLHLQKHLITSLLDEDANIKYVHEGNSILRSRLNSKKVLIVLDDVDNIEHLEFLSGKNDKKGKCFGARSRIIVTTRDKHLLKSYGVKDIYSVEELTNEESNELFCYKAFKENCPPDEFVQLCSKFVKYSNGLPLALEVLGSFLSGRSKDEWLDAFSLLEHELMKDIFVSLRRSYDELREQEKAIFLDIACFFIGEDQYRVRKILEACGFPVVMGTSVLIDKSLITIEQNALSMNDLIKQMGLQIVRQEYQREPHKCSRLWHDEDIYDTLARKMGTEAIEGIILKSPVKRKIHLNDDPFSKMYNLRLLKIDSVNISGISRVPDNLRLLEWHGYPLKSMPLLPHKLVELRLNNSYIEEIPITKVPLKGLLVLDLSNCQNVTKIPNFIMFPNLEMLILEGCTKLSEVDPSINKLTGLILVNLKDCKNLLSLPNEIWSMTSLRTLNLSGCSNLPPLPKHNLENLEILLPCSVKVAEQCTKHKIDRTLEECIRKDAKVIKDEIMKEKTYDRLFPWKGLVEWMSYSSMESYIRIKPPTDLCSGWIGLALFVKFEIHDHVKFDKSLESGEIQCWFWTNKGRLESPLDFEMQKLKASKARSCGYYFYVPKSWFGDQLDEVSFLEASVSKKPTNRSDVEVKRCGIHLVNNKEEDIEEFAKKFAHSIYGVVFKFCNYCNSEIIIKLGEGVAS